MTGAVGSNFRVVRLYGDSYLDIVQLKKVGRVIRPIPTTPVMMNSTP